MIKSFIFLFFVQIVCFAAGFEFSQQLQEKYDCPANCVDLWGECQAYAQFCQDPKKGSVIRSKCPCTCQVCPPSPASSTTISQSSSTSLQPSSSIPSIVPSSTSSSVSSTAMSSSSATTQPIADQLKCRPANLVFVMDTSQSIDGGFYNSTVRAFVKKIALGYPMKGEITEPSSRIGVVQFASDATVTYPLIERTRNELLTTIDGGVYYADQGITNISLGLIKALEEFNTQGIAAHDNVMVILVTDGVSTFDIRQTKPAADRVRAYTNFFAGVGIDGINGNDISANLTNLITLIGNQDLAFADIKHAEDPSSGIWSESRKIYPCPTY